MPDLEFDLINLLPTVAIASAVDITARIKQAACHVNRKGSLPHGERLSKRSLDG
jgi:hypothetical protein